MGEPKIHAPKKEDNPTEDGKKNGEQDGPSSEQNRFRQLEKRAIKKMKSGEPRKTHSTPN